MNKDNNTSQADILDGLERNGVSLNSDIERHISEDDVNRSSLLSPYAAKLDSCIREDGYEYSIYRKGYIRDCEAIMNLPQYNRYFGKTQVFSLYADNDISNRAYHVQLVSKIARAIGRALKLNESLIEAIALAHDLGHAPFGHKGEKELDRVVSKHGYRFYHHIQGARYLDEIVKANISLQVIDGVMCHNGEKLYSCYAPTDSSVKGFMDLREKLDLAYKGKLTDEMLFPSTLEGCLVRICDVIAYLGKDRQDAHRLSIVKETEYVKTLIGVYNHEIIGNVSKDIINNSYGKNEIRLSKEVFESMQEIMKENYNKIYYSNHTIPGRFIEYVEKKGYTDTSFLSHVFDTVYDYIYDDLTKDGAKLLNRLYFPRIHPNKNKGKEYKNRNKMYPERVAADYLASMSDEYLLEFYFKYIENEQNPRLKQGFFE